MEKGKGKSGEEREREEKQDEEKMVEKLKRCILVGKKGGPTTPVLSWSHTSTRINNNSCNSINKNKKKKEQAPSLALVSISTTTSVPSARKLAAALWEFIHYSPSLVSSKMHRPGFNSNRKQQKRTKDKKAVDLSDLMGDPCPSTSPDRPESASSLRRHVAASLMQHRRLLDRNNHALQPVSPASYGSSLEVAPYKPAGTPTSSLDFKGRVGESHFGLKTSTELLKVLNRIWSLEEQHASSDALIKALKTQLEHARVRIKDLLRDQQADRCEMDGLMKQIAEEKQVRKSRELDRIRAAVQSVKDELEDERKLRRRSESLHRKLARDLSDVKSSLSAALKDLEKERKSRILLEDLCDEFAKGIKEYESELHALKQKSENDWAGSEDLDRLILHVSESWLDERMQMKLEEAEHGVARQSSTVEKLGFEIETFLQAKRMGLSKIADHTSRRKRRTSLESVPLNDVISAPQDLGYEEDSAGSDSNCFELNRANGDNSKPHEDEIVNHPCEKTVELKNKIVSPGRIKKRSQSNLQVKFEEQMAWAMSCNGNKKSDVVKPEDEIPKEGNPVQTNVSRKSEQHEAAEDTNIEGKVKHNEIHASSSNNLADNLIIRSQLAGLEDKSTRLQHDIGEASCSGSAWRNLASPVRQWKTKLTPPDIGLSESSSRLPPGLKENTLKAKLLEARSKGQRSRLRATKLSS